jgi:hypothetical protein
VSGCVRQSYPRLILAFKNKERLTRRDEVVRRVASTDKRR